MEVICALQVIRRDEVSGAATLLYKVLVDRGVSWSAACEMLTNAIAAVKAAAERSKVRFIIEIAALAIL